MVKDTELVRQPGQGLFASIFSAIRHERRRASRYQSPTPSDEPAVVVLILRGRQEKLLTTLVSGQVNR